MTDSIKPDTTLDFEPEFDKTPEFEAPAETAFVQAIINTSISPEVEVDITPEIDLQNSEFYLNRELSQLEFNRRVLTQAMDEGHPLLNRLLFMCIFSSNMDEFFEIRVASLKHQINYSREQIGIDRMTPQETIKRIKETMQTMVDYQYHIFNNVLLPALAEANIYTHVRHEWTDAQQAWVRLYFENNVLPVISPIGLDPSHPFPRLVNKSLNFICSLEGKDAYGRDTGLAIVPAPKSLPRIIRLPDEICNGGDNFIFLSSIIHAHVNELFPGMSVTGCYQFRITRNADLVVNHDKIDDLATALRGELYSRSFGDAVRLEVAHRCPEPLIDFLLAEFKLSQSDLYLVNGPVNLMRMNAILSQVNRPDLLYPPFAPGVPKILSKKNNMFERLAKQDILLFHPYESFTPVIDLLRDAASDPLVLAIKQTLYRTGAKSELVTALVDAARRGKEVTVVIELRARFDEEENLELASRLQEAGVVVVYGLVKFKTHAKMILIVRRENDKLTRYAHLGTGNYHAGNAKLYTDYSFITCDDEITEDVHNIFQQLTGMGKVYKMNKLLHAPFTLHKRFIELINRETEHAKNGLPAYIILKINALTEPRLIRALFRASQAGVKVDLIIRGVCCLRPDIEGVSENIHVRSIIGRFLEHTRTYYFQNNESPEVYGSSADGMERNLINRVEIGFPVNEKIGRRIKEDLDTYLQDNCQSWRLRQDGTYVLNQPQEGEPMFSAQHTLLEKLTKSR